MFACVCVCLCVISVHFPVLWLTTTAVYINGGWQHVDLFPLNIASTVLFTFVQMHQISPYKSCFFFIFDNNFDQWGEIRHLIVLPSNKQYLKKQILFIHYKSLKLSYTPSSHPSSVSLIWTFPNLKLVQKSCSKTIHRSLHNNYFNIQRPECSLRSSGGGLFCNF